MGGILLAARIIFTKYIVDTNLFQLVVGGLNVAICLLGAITIYNVTHEMDWPSNFNDVEEKDDASNIYPTG
jgi:drug/metabolite transporter (DMT)-like permease